MVPDGGKFHVLLSEMALTNDVEDDADEMSSNRPKTSAILAAVGWPTAPMTDRRTFDRREQRVLGVRGGGIRLVSVSDGLICQ